MIATRTFTPRLPIDLPRTFGPVVHGTRDPSWRVSADVLWWATNTPLGPATLQVRRVGSELRAQGWGDGADWILDTAPGLLGADDDLTGFEPRHPVVARCHHRSPGLRVVRTGQVADVLVPTILAQKVTGLEAARAWLRIVRRWGRPAPGPAPGMMTPPTCAELATHPYWEFHEVGVERRRAETIRLACRRIDRLEEALRMSRPDAVRRLCALPGLGEWTANRVLRWAAGDADAVEVGDYHVPNLVSWNLAGEPRGDDARMLELLDGFTGHRGRVIRLLDVAAQRAPAYGARQRPGTVERL